MTEPWLDRALMDSEYKSEGTTSPTHFGSWKQYGKECINSDLTGATMSKSIFKTVAYLSDNWIKSKWRYLQGTACGLNWTR